MTASIPAVCIGRLDGGDAPSLWYQESNSLVRKKGQFATLSSGQLDDATGTGSIVGMLAMDARNATSDAPTNLLASGTLVYLATPEVIFEMQVFHSTAASNTNTIGLIGKSFAIKASAATEIDALDIETTAAATDQFTVIALSNKDAAGTTEGRVWAIVNPGNSCIFNRIAH